MALSQEERMRVRGHLGYPQVSSLTLLSIGVPIAGQPHFVLERQMDHVLPEAEKKLREILCECDSIESQLRQSRERLSVAATGETKFRGSEELADLQDLYERWTDRLADFFAAVKNPTSEVHHRSGYRLE